MSTIISLKGDAEKEALENGELITSFYDPRKHGEKVNFEFDPNKPVIVLKEKFLSLDCKNHPA